MILCLGTVGSGKSVLLKELQLHEAKREKTKEGKSNGNVDNAKIASDNATANTIPTIGTNLVTLTPPGQNRKPGLSGGSGLNQETEPECVVVREVGGSMAPLWHSYIESGRTRAVLYVVDASSPETVGASTIHLVELLHRPGLEPAQVMVVFTKTDLPSARTLGEIVAVMRLGQISAASKQIVRHVSFSCKECKDKENISTIYDWCLLFAAPKRNSN